MNLVWSFNKTTPSTCGKKCSGPSRAKPHWYATMACNSAGLSSIYGTGLHVVSRKDANGTGLHVVSRKDANGTGLHAVSRKDANGTGLHAVSRKDANLPKPNKKNDLQFPTPIFETEVLCCDRTGTWKMMSHELIKFVLQNKVTSENKVYALIVKKKSILVQILKNIAPMHLE